MKALGSRGGRGRTRSVLGIDDSVAEDLRPKAKAVLEQMLDSPDEAKRLAAARSLYSYQAVRPVDQDRTCTCYTKPGLYCSAVDEHGYRSAHQGVSTEEVARIFQQISPSFEPLPTSAEIMAGRTKDDGDEAA